MNFQDFLRAIGISQQQEIQPARLQSPAGADKYTFGTNENELTAEMVSPYSSIFPPNRTTNQETMASHRGLFGQGAKMSPTPPGTMTWPFRGTVQEPGDEELKMTPDVRAWLNRPRDRNWRKDIRLR